MNIRLPQTKDGESNPDTVVRFVASLVSLAYDYQQDASLDHVELGELLSDIADEARVIAGMADKLADAHLARAEDLNGQAGA